MFNSFDELLKFYMSSFKGYSAEQKRRIFRRRPREFRERWKKLYPKWFRHQVLFLGKGSVIQEELMRKDYFFKNIEKDTAWSGRRVTFPAHTNEEENNA